MGTGKSSIFDIIYNTDIYNDKIHITYYEDDDHLCEDDTCVTLSTDSYKNNTDYYFGDTAYSKATSAKKVVGTSNGLKYSNNIERSSDSFIQKTIISRTASALASVPVSVDAAGGVAVKAKAKKMRVISKKNKDTFKASVVGRALSAMAKDGDKVRSDTVETKDTILPTKIPAKKRTVV